VSADRYSYSLAPNTPIVVFPMLLPAQRQIDRVEAGKASPQGPRPAAKRSLAGVPSAAEVSVVHV
jgi:hypothetical protein